VVPHADDRRRRRALERLTPEQRDALLRAGRSAIEPALQRLEGDEARSLARTCRGGALRFVSASPRQLAALGAAVRPVYAALERDARTRRQVEAIRRLRGPHAASAAVASCRHRPKRGASAAATPLDGTWRMTVTRAELIRLGTAPIEAAAVHGSRTYTIGGGRFDIRNRDLGYVWSGSATVSARAIRIVVERCPTDFPPGCRPGETYEQRWSRYRDTVTFEGVPGRTSAPIFLVKPWTHE